MSVFETLNKIDVSNHIEQKNGLNYLSWAWAWTEVKKLYPNAQYKIYETAEGCIYWTDGKTAWVKTGVIIEGLEHIEYLPIMDYNNRSIPLDKITSFDVNKAIQRSLTKAVARHGLGLYVYAGEDLPEETQQAETETKPLPVKKPDPVVPKGDLASPQQIKFIDDLLTQKGITSKEVDRVLGLKRSNLSRKEANTYIDYLKSLPNPPKREITEMVNPPRKPMDEILDEATKDLLNHDEDELPL